MGVHEVKAPRFLYKGCQPYAPATFTPEIFLVLIFTRDYVEPRAMSLKNPVTPPGIDPGTVRLVAQRLNHYATVGIAFSRVAVHRCEPTADYRWDINSCKES